MNKIKLVTKTGICRILIRSKKGQQLSERELHAINNGEVPGLIPLSVVGTPAKFTLIYELDGFITFSRFLSSPLNKKLFAGILQSILTTLKSMSGAFFNQQHLLMGLNYVMVQPSTREVYFSYVPIQGFETEMSLKEFLLSIIQEASFSPTENNSYVQDYITILNNGLNFSVFQLEEYIKQLKGGEPAKAEKTIRCPKCNTVLAEHAEFCSSCGAKVGASKGPAKVPTTYDPLASSGSSMQRDDRRIRQPAWTSQGQIDCEDGTSILGSGDMGKIYPTPYLVRSKTKERIPLDRMPFKIGKLDGVCDYVIRDNKAVSRKHAEIICINDRYYIVDLNSTNKTYVNGKPVLPEAKSVISHGTTIKLGNEEFVFRIE